MYLPTPYSLTLTWSVQLSNDAINPAGTGIEALPASTPEYAPAAQTVVEDVPTGEAHTVTVESPSTTPLPDNTPYVAPREPEPQDTPATPGASTMPGMPIPAATPAHPPTLPSAPTPVAPVTPVTPVASATPVSPVLPVSPVSPVMPATAVNPIAPSATHAAALPAFAPSPSASPEKRLYDLLLEEFSRDPRFELHTNVRALMQDVQDIKALAQHANAPAAAANDLAAIRETVEKIWTHAQETGNREQGTEEKTEDRRQKTEEANPQSAIEYRQSAIPPTPELISETRALVRSVNEEVNATRNSVIQLTNQGRMMLDVATRCLREMDKTAQKYEQQGETGALLDELRSLRDMLADGFENARLEPIAPTAGEPFRYSDHRADNGFASSGKIKRTIFPGFRWTQPNPPVVLLPAIVETE